MKSIPEHQRLYHHWSYDPIDDEAYINRNQDYDHNGYAYRIDGGWRITDRDHNTVEDPYIIKKIMEGLRGERSQFVPPNDYNFNKLHYGQPLPMKGQ